MKYSVNVKTAMGIVEVVDNYGDVKWFYDEDCRVDDIKSIVDNAYDEFVYASWTSLVPEDIMSDSSIDFVNVAEEIKAITNALYEATVYIGNVNIQEEYDD